MARDLASTGAPARGGADARASDRRRRVPAAVLAGEEWAHEPAHAAGRLMTLDEWLATAAASLGVDLSALGDAASLRAELLDVAREAAHGVARPAAPLTTFVLGVAVGRGMDVGDAAAAIRRVLPEASADGVSPSAL